MPGSSFFIWLIILCSASPLHDRAWPVAHRVLWWLSPSPVQWTQSPLQRQKIPHVGTSKETKNLEIPSVPRSPSQGHPGCFDKPEESSPAVRRPTNKQQWSALATWRAISFHVYLASRFQSFRKWSHGGEQLGFQDETCQWNDIIMSYKHDIVITNPTCVNIKSST